jgi:hypothetical protein
MKGSFRTMVTAALSLILGLQIAPARGSIMTVPGATQQPVGTMEIRADQEIVPTQYNEEKLAIEMGSIPEVDSAGADQFLATVTTVTYTGSQLSGSLKSWDAREHSADALFSSAADQKARALRVITNQPFQSIVNEVSAPAAAWQILASIMAILVAPLLRAGKSALPVGVPVKN